MWNLPHQTTSLYPNLEPVPLSISTQGNHRLVQISRETFTNQAFHSSHDIRVTELANH
jgi:hypothetical protein